MAIDQKAAERTLARIDEAELVDLVLALSSVESPAGQEGEVGEAIHDWLPATAFGRPASACSRTASTSSPSWPGAAAPRSRSTVTSTPLSGATST